MLATPDHDQATLIRVRDFFDAVAAGAPAPIALDVPGARVALRWNDLERAARDRVFQYRVARAIAHARTLSFVEAQRQLVAVLRATPDAWLAWQNLAFVYAATDRWDDAVRAIAEATRRNPERPMARALLAMLTDARTRVQAAPAHSPEREAAACTALVDLHVYEAARRRLDRALMTWPTHTALRVLRARVESEEHGVRTQ
jgi:predicted Zn-dependent protease